MLKLILQKAIILLLFAVSSVAYSQAEMQAKKYYKPEWKRVILFKFKPDKFSRAKEIIDSYYLKACEKSGSQMPSSFTEIVSGEWDMILIWNMQEGIEEMNWQVSPNDVKWMKGINEITGSASQTKIIMDEFSSLIDKKVTYIGKSGM